MRPHGRFDAFGLTAGLGDFGLAIRSAIHTGEIEFRDDDIGGIGVHIAARTLAQAGDREVVVTQAVRDLVTGTDLAFSPLGAVGLAEFPVSGSCSLLRRDDMDDPERRNAASSSGRRRTSPWYATSVVQ